MADEMAGCLRGSCVAVWVASYVAMWLAGLQLAAYVAGWSWVAAYAVWRACGWLGYRQRGWVMAD